MTLWNIIYLVGIMIACVGVMQILPLALSVGFGDGHAASLALTCAASVLFGLLLVRAGSRKRRTILSNSEALACVGLCWIAATCAGALPYVSTGFMNPVDAWFESVSGFTTTGSSILSDIEALPQSLLFWRSLTQWCGGMGIIVLSLAVLPHLGVGGMQLYRAEVPGPTPDKLAPRIQDTAKILWSGYCVLTAVMVVCLMMAGMNVLDAVNHAFATLATGGFSTKNASAAAFSPAVQWIIIVSCFWPESTLLCIFVLSREDGTPTAKARNAVSSCCSALCLRCLPQAFCMWRIWPPFSLFPMRKNCCAARCSR